MKFTALLLLFVCAIIPQLRAASTGTDLRWQSSISSFKEYDSENSYPKNAVLFVGSDIINIWKTADCFPEFGVINRGFGGSNVQDLFRYYNDIILKYKPATIVIGTGDAECASKRATEMIVSDFKSLLEKLRADLPHAKIIVLSVPKSPARSVYFGKIDAVNANLAEYIKQKGGKNIEFFDVNTVVCDQNKTPQKDMFRKNMLHFRRAAYTEISKNLRSLLK